MNCRASGPLPRPFGVIPGSLRPTRSHMAFPISRPSSFPRSSFTSIPGDEIATFRTPPDSPLSPMVFCRSALNSENSAPIQLQGETRKVCHLFAAVLPDELRLDRFGELLMIVRSFDDGWCLVGRVKRDPTYHLSPMSPFDPHLDAQNRGSECVLGVVGVVPASCFLMSCKGIWVERPIRKSSLGITFTLDVDGAKIRSNCQTSSSSCCFTNTRNCIADFRH